MGKANRSRRAANQKRRSDDQRAHRYRAGHFIDAEQLVLAALGNLDCAEHEQCRARARQAIARLSREGDALWSRAVDAALFGLYMDVLENKCWPEGWQPADLARVAARELGAASRRVVTDLMAAQLRAYAPAAIDEVWHGQLAELDARTWWSTDGEYVKELTATRGLDRHGAVDLLVALLGLLARLPRLEALTALPGAARRRTTAHPGAQVDDKLLARVRNLLAKAEGTTYAAEAETFTTAAQAMMARHSIDEAMLHRPDGPDPDRPGGIRLGVDNPYPEPKAVLLQQIAEANRCRAVWSQQLGFTTVLGYRADVAWVELLYTSLLVQATTAITKAGAKSTTAGTSRTRAFRASFLESFATRIGERLRRATEQAQTEAVRDTGADLLPVLADRGQAVDDELHRIFPETTSAYRGFSHTTDREGWIAGHAAADLADLSRHNAVQTSTRSH